MKKEHIEDIINQLKWKQFSMPQIFNELIAHNISTIDIAQAVINQDNTGNTSHQLLNIYMQSEGYDQECKMLADHINYIDDSHEIVYFAKLVDDAIIPEKMHDNDACYDLYSNQQVLIRPGEYKIVNTDVGIVMPEGYAALVCSRSGITVKHGMNVMNAPGIIDSNYRDQIKVILHYHKNNNRQQPLNISKHSRIAQLLITKLPDLTTKTISRANFQYLYGNTDRGTDGLGSTGM